MSGESSAINPRSFFLRMEESKQKCFNKKKVSKLISLAKNNRAAWLQELEACDKDLITLLHYTLYKYLKYISHSEKKFSKSERDEMQTFIDFANSSVFQHVPKEVIINYLQYYFMSFEEIIKYSFFTKNEEKK